MSFLPLCSLLLQTHPPTGPGEDSQVGELEREASFLQSDTQGWAPGIRMAAWQRFFWQCVYKMECQKNQRWHIPPGRGNMKSVWKADATLPPGPSTPRDWKLSLKPNRSRPGSNHGTPETKPWWKNDLHTHTTVCQHVCTPPPSNNKCVI